MAELVWKNKSIICRPLCSSIPISTDCRLITDQYYTPVYASVTTPPRPDEAWYNRLILGDKQELLPALLQEFRASVKLIYIDPPFMTGRTFTHGQRIAYRD